VVRLNYLTGNNISKPKRYFFLWLLGILILPAVFPASASFIKATRMRDNIFGYRLSAFALPGLSGNKAAKELAQGMLLIADRQLMDPNFRETVIFLVGYGPEGAMGLVINRPLQVKLSAIFPDIKELDQINDTLYRGGPVEPSGILLLVKSNKPPKASQRVFGDVYLSASRSVLKRLIIEPEKEERFRIFAGYAGWAPKQLESECNRGDWHVLQADAETIFDRDPAEIWPDLIQRATVKWVRTNTRDRSGIQRAGGWAEN
jgi:putative transcriptional regulator